MGAIPDPTLPTLDDTDELLAGLMVEHGWRPWDIDRLTEHQYGLLVGWIAGKGKATEARYGRH